MCKRKNKEGRRKKGKEDERGRKTKEGERIFPLIRYRIPEERFQQGGNKKGIWWALSQTLEGKGAESFEAPSGARGRRAFVREQRELGRKKANDYNRLSFQKEG